MPGAGRAGGARARPAGRLLQGHAAAPRAGRRPGGAARSWSSSTSRPARSTRSAGPTSATSSSSLRERGVAVLLNSPPHRRGRAGVRPRGRARPAAGSRPSGTLAELLGQREVRLHLTGLTAGRRAAAARRSARSSARASGRRWRCPDDDVGTPRARTSSPTWSRSACGCTRSSRRGSAWRSGCSAILRAGAEQRRVTTVLTVAGLTLREAARRRVLLALAVLTVRAAGAERLGLLAAGRRDRRRRAHHAARPGSPPPSC